MKVFLMYRDRDFASAAPLPPNQGELTQDLSLDLLLECMSNGDKFLFQVAREALLSSFGNDIATIRHRQGVLQDCLRHREVVERLFDLAGKALDGEKREVWGPFLNESPSSRLHGAVRGLEIFMESLRRLRSVADEHGKSFSSAGFTRLFGSLQNELSDDYLTGVEAHLRQMRLRDGALLSAELGEGNKGQRYSLHKPPRPKGSWLKQWLREHLGEWLFESLNDGLKQIVPTRPAPYTVYIHPRDENGARYLSEIQDRGILPVANALARSRDHIRNFLTLLRRELAFYIGCVNLHAALDKEGLPACFPLPEAPEGHALSFEGLGDACLALSTEQPVIGNDAHADGKPLVLITGANRGGKSTFLRSVGLAQLMMQAGLFVPATSYRASLCDGLFTHFKREEDASMKSGKFAEELDRMSAIAELITPGSMILFNESFAATNEREGSEVAYQIVSALLENGVRVLFVTHFYEFPRRCQETKAGTAVFLRAERLADGSRPFKLVEGAPLDTSYGEDLYKVIFA